MDNYKKEKIAKNAAARGFVAFQKSYAQNYIKYNDYARGYR